jgi:hypothetical protein
MNHLVDFWELITGVGVAIGTVITAWMNMRINISSLKQDMMYLAKELEAEKIGSKESIMALTAKIDTLIETINELKTDLATQRAKYENSSSN